MAKSVEDRFEQYFAEKLWEMIPAVYRHEDGLDTNPSKGVLRALVEILAEQAAILRRSQDRLWEDQFIDLCSDWATPYIADLLGTRLVSAHNPRGRRVDVAKTIYYRRRKGTLRILEELISDIAGWDGKVVENFRRLVRARHGLDPDPAAGRHSGTLPGGWADLRQAGTAELSGGPFDEFFHTPDVRRHQGRAGRYNIPKLAFHLYRLPSFEVREVTPYALSDGEHFTFDPSGREIPLFARGRRLKEWDDWHSACEWELPLPIRCRLLREYAERLLPDSLVVKTGPGADAIPAGETLAAHLQVWLPSAGLPSKLAVDPENGRFQLKDQPPGGTVEVNYHYGAPGPIGAGTFDRVQVKDCEPTQPPKEGGGPITTADLPAEGVLQIADNKTYGPVGSKAGIRNLTLQAANQRRPYLRLAGDWILTSDQTPDAGLTLDGLWLGGKAPDDWKVILEGDYECVVIRYCTLDPGGQKNISNKIIRPLQLVVEGKIEKLIIDGCITGPIRTGANGDVEQLLIRDSILQSVDAGQQALHIASGTTTLVRSTVFGDLHVHRLLASEVLITGRATVQDPQGSCFRFGAYRDDSPLAFAYESHPFKVFPRHWFTSQHFGRPGYGQWSETAPVKVRRGAENGSEIGAFCRLNNPIKLDGLRAKVEEYMPFGLIPLFIFET